MERGPHPAQWPATLPWSSWKPACSLSASLALAICSHSEPSEPTSACPTLFHGSLPGGLLVLWSSPSDHYDVPAASLPFTWSLFPSLQAPTWVSLPTETFLQLQVVSTL